MAERALRGSWIAIPRSTGSRPASLRRFGAGSTQTLAATIIAGSLQLDVYRLDLGAVVSKYVEETEKNLQTLLALAESSQAVLLFDESDELFGSRTGGSEMDVATLSGRMALHGGAAVLPVMADVRIAARLMPYRISVQSVSRRLIGRRASRHEGA